MRKIMALALCLLAAACATPQQTVGTATGAGVGAVVGGPVGAVVGGAVGASLRRLAAPGYCYVRGRHGHILRHHNGSPVVRRC